MLIFLEDGWGKKPKSFFLALEVPDAAFPLVLTSSRNNPAEMLLGFDSSDPSSFSSLSFLVSLPSSLHSLLY